MDRHKRQATTVRFEPEDREALEQIKKLYGCPSDNAAIKLALRMVARREISPPSHPGKEDPFPPHS